MRILLSFVFLLMFSLVSFAQEKTTVSGSVFDNTTQEPVEQASIRILNAKDSAYVTGAVTNESGRFRIQLNRGKYIFNVTYLGYTGEFINVDVADKAITLPAINLKDDGILLKEAVITAKAVEVMVKGDTIEYNADSYKVQESAVVEDLLKKMPGVEVDSEGKITVNGKEVKKILVDGKEFFSNDPKIASKNLPASMVNKLQVLDKKSDMSLMTGFDDGNEETVINLTVKPGMKEGVFGNAYAGYGSKDRYETNLMTSYMRNNNQFTLIGGANNTNNAGFSDFASSAFGGMRPPKGINFGNNNGITESLSGGLNFATEMSPSFKWGGDLRYGNTDGKVESESLTQYLRGNGKDEFRTSKGYGRNKSDNLGLNLRFEWDVDSVTKMIFTPTLQYNKNKNWQTEDFFTTQGSRDELNNTLINKGYSDNFMDGKGINLNGTLDISRKLNEKGRVISLGLSGGLNDSDADGYNKSNTEFFLDSSRNKIVDQTVNQKNDGYNWRAYLSMVEPLGRNNFLQLTYSYAKNYSKSDKQTYQANTSIIDTADTRLLKNDFVNQEIGLNFKAVREKYNYTIGVAVQPSSSSNRILSVDKFDLDTTIRVVNFSPTIQFNYIWDRSSNLRIDYKGITNQPTASQLSTGKNQSDPLNITTGNPNLKPTFENRLNIRFRKFVPEQQTAYMLFGRFSYSLDDIVQSSTSDTATAQRTTTYKNVDGNMSGNLRFIFNTPLRNKKFSVNSMSYVSYTRSKGFISDTINVANNWTFRESAGLDYRSDLFDVGIRGNFGYNNISNTRQKSQTDYTYGGNLNTTIYLPYDFTIESDINYAANSGFSEGFSQNEWLWNASISKNIFKAKNGTIRFKIYDILHDRSNISRSSTSQEISDVTTNTINSYFMFHFVYKFQLFKGGVKQSDMEDSQRRGFGGGGRGPGGGRPPRM